MSIKLQLKADKQYEVIRKLQTLLPADQFIVTGSYALAKYGLILPSLVEDLDIILLNPTETARTNMGNLQRDFPARTNEFYPEKSDQFNFVMDDVKIDVFVMTSFTEPTLLIDGIEYATIPWIIKAKKKYGRMKDWIQLRSMAKSFCTAEEMNKVLDSYVPSQKDVEKWLEKRVPFTDQSPTKAQPKKKRVEDDEDFD